MVCVASSADKTYCYVPKDYTIPTDADYFHITTNNTIYGTEIRTDMDCPVTLVADMSSDIMSRPVDVRKYGMIYGGAQKNVGPAGVTFVIVRKDILGKVRPLFANDVGLQNSRWRRFDVQHASCILDLRNDSNLEMA